MSVKYRVFIVMKGCGRPVRTAEISHILGVQITAVTGAISRLCSYGHARVVTEPGQRPVKYELTGKPLKEIEAAEATLVP